MRAGFSHVSKLHQRTHEEILTQMINSSKLALSAVQAEVNQVEKELNSIYRGLQNQQKMQFKGFVDSIHICQSKIISILESFCESMMRSANKKASRSKDDLTMSEKVKKHKLNVLKREKVIPANAQIKEQQIAEINEELLSQLSKCQAKPTWYYLCSTTPLYSSHQTNQVHINQQMNEAISSMISTAETSLKQFEEVYSYSLDDQTINQLFQCLRNEYQRAARQILTSVPSKEEIIRMRALCLKVKATVQEQIKKVKKKEDERLSSIKKK